MLSLMLQRKGKSRKKLISSRERLIATAGEKEDGPGRLPNMETYIDYQNEEYLDHACDDGVYQLWLAVTFDAVKTFKVSRGKNESAKSFLFEENNPFVEAVCDQLYISPEVMRERIREKVTSW